jgi:hypothetical protein
MYHSWQIERVYLGSFPICACVGGHEIALMRMILAVALEIIVGAARYQVNKKIPKIGTYWESPDRFVGVAQTHMKKLANFELRMRCSS